MDLGNMAEVSKTWPLDGAEVIYLRLFRGLQELVCTVRYTNGLYTGQSRHTPNRKTAHDRETSRASSSSKSNHYRIASKAAGIRMVPIIISDGVGMPANFLSVAELAFVCLTKSWHPILTTHGAAPLAAQGAYSIDFDAAGTFFPLMQAVADRTG